MAAAEGGEAGAAAEGGEVVLVRRDLVGIRRWIDRSGRGKKSVWEEEGGGESGGCKKWCTTIARSVLFKATT